MALGSLEYAVAHLHAPLLVVVGHDHCGAVAAAASGAVMPTPNLTAIVDMIRPALAGLESRYSGEELLRQGVDANVRRSAADLLANSPILREAVDSGKLTLRTAVYRLTSGEVVPLVAQ